MRCYLPQTVLDAALERIRFVFDEFPQVVAATSGGKDSTVIVHLALQVAAERGRLPLPVVFIDQEAEWDSVIATVRGVMHDPRVRPYWLQVPIRLFNATSMRTPWLYCWEPGADWIRPQEPDSIRVNRYGTDRFKKLFSRFLAVEFPDQPVALLGGVRAEESPARLRTLAYQARYKWVTWAKAHDRQAGQYTFYPIYDWSTSDVWKAIHDHGWPYCPLYDALYQYGVPIRQMRVSNVHHETAVHALFHLQEIEADTWNRICRRLPGIHTAGQFGRDDFFVHELPTMFADWREYRDYLLEQLILPEQQPVFARRFAQMEDRLARHYYLPKVTATRIHRLQVQSILTNDFEHTKLDNFESNFMLNARQRREHHGH